MRSDRAICRCVRCAAESRCAAAARSGIIGLTIRDSSCCHRMAVGIRQVCGRLSAARSCVCRAGKCVRPRRRGCDAFGRFVHSAWVWRVWPGAIRWLGSDLRSGQGVWILMAVLELRRGARSDELRRRDSCTFLEHAIVYFCLPSFTFVYVHVPYLRLPSFITFVYFCLLLFTFVYCLPFWHLSVTFEGDGQTH